MNIEDLDLKKSKLNQRNTKSIQLDKNINYLLNMFLLKIIKKYKVLLMKKSRI